MISIVTGNTGKYEQIIEQLPVGVATEQVNFDILEIQTNLLTEISADKCRQAYAQVQGPVLVEDSGIYFDAYDMFPGALTKFLYTGVGMEGIQRLFFGEENMRACFLCALSYMDETMSEPLQFVGECPGEMTFDRLDKIQEDSRLPYDLIFMPEGMNEPAICDMKKRKSDLSHRVRAVKQFSEWLIRGYSELT